MCICLWISYEWKQLSCLECRYRNDWTNGMAPLVYSGCRLLNISFHHLDTSGCTIQVIFSKKIFYPINSKFMFNPFQTYWCNNCWRHRTSMVPNCRIAWSAWYCSTWAHRNWEIVILLQFGRDRRYVLSYLCGARGIARGRRLRNISRT